MSKALIGRGKPASVVIAVQCGKKRRKSSIEAASPDHSNSEQQQQHRDDRPPDLVSGGQLEVIFLDCPSFNELKQRLEMSQPQFLLFLGERLPGKQEVGPLSLGEKLVSADNIKALIGAKVPDAVYFEAASTSKVGLFVHSLGASHVVAWRGTVTCSVAAHFRQAFVAALRSPGCDPFDAYELANASLEMHCSHFRDELNGVNEALLLGEPPPSLYEPPPSTEDDASVPMIQIYDEQVELRLLICAEAASPGSKSFEAVEAGIASLLAIEVRNVRLIHRISAPPPPSAAATFARGVVTMRCDLCTSSSARISLVVSGSAQTCFADQFLEATIRKELLDKGQSIQLVLSPEDCKQPEIRRSVSVACGAAVVEMRARVPNWAAQTLRQLSTDVSYKTLVAMGVAGVDGAPVAAFHKEDAERLGRFKARCNGSGSGDMAVAPPRWFLPAAPTRKRSNLYLSSDGEGDKSFLAAMKPIPHATRRKLMPFAGVVSAGAQAGWSMKINGNTKSSAKPEGAAAAAPGHGHARGGHTFPIVLPNVKKHHCNRPSILDCPEEEFLNDVVQFLVSRGHGRLIPPSGIESFPDVVLNGKRLDLYNLYREVVSRGGFRVGNGINWKGQIFSKMRNHTTTNRMTGVGNTLKKHYETYLLEYELAHDDVDGECCILCRSSAEGDWVNCGNCGDWAHFGCDKRNGLATFKEYAKTDGLEYICPGCSNRASARKKQRLSSDGNTLITLQMKTRRS